MPIKNRKKIIVVGGGASGMMAAIMAARSNASVTILEKADKPGRKLLATGNGRCNLTNLNQDLSCYHGDQEKIHTVLSQFSSDDTLAFFRELGLWTKDREGWVYPRTDQAQSVLQLLLRELNRLGCNIKTRETVTEIRLNSEKADIEAGQRRFTVFTEGWHYDADAVILASGTPASNIEGVSDDALTFARNFGHKAKDFRPSLAPVRCVRESFFPKWAGVRTQALLTLTCSGEEIAREQGEVQLTDYGISGIPAFQLSSAAGALLANGKEPVIHINFLPEYEQADPLLSLLKDLAENHPEKSTAQLFEGLLPDKLIPILVKKKGAVQDVLDRCRDLKVRPAKVGPLRQSQVCAGGVLLRELTDSMESKIIPGLYFTGECCDVDGRCGGYNLQWAWSSGACAGRAAAKSSGSSEDQLQQRRPVAAAKSSGSSEEQ